MVEKYECPCCGYVYNERTMPFDFRCPVCRTSGAIFNEIEAKNEQLSPIEADEATLERDVAMNKQELIRYLKLLRGATISADDYRIKELRAYERVESAKKAKQTDVTLKKIGPIDVFFTLIISAILGGITFLVAPPIIMIIDIIVGILAKLLFRIDINFSDHWTFICTVAAVIIIFVGSIWLSLDGQREKNHKEYEDALLRNKRMADLSANLQMYEKEYAKAKEEHAQKERALNALRGQGILHREYWDPTTIGGIISILEQGRADTLKEAINLHVQEVREEQRDYELERERIHQRKMAEQQLQELQNIRSESTRAANAAEDASRSADDAAFWSEVTAYLVDKKLK